MATPPEETGLIQKYLLPLAGPGGLGLTDDAACLSANPGMDWVITTDTIVENVHFLAADTPFDIAIKAITVNLSDLVAKGADPVGYQIALSLPQKPGNDWIADFASGLAEQISGRLLGGDITVSHGGPLTISVTAIGEVPAGKMVRRDGASVGDAIYVCGAIGTRAAGLKCALDENWAKRSGLTPVEVEELVSSYRAPRVPCSDQVAGLLRDNATAALDISDGLVIDLERLCAASKVGASIDVEAIPLDPAVRRLIEMGGFSLLDAITGGDDYVALFTAAPEHASGIDACRIPDCRQIGTVTSLQQGVTFSKPDGSGLSLEGRKGYDHFSSEQETVLKLT